MEVVYPGHTYKLRHLDGDGFETLQFQQRMPMHEQCAGTTNQEVCRALIDRLQVLNSEKPWQRNEIMIAHLRNIIFEHEVRAHFYHLEKQGRNVGIPNARYMVWNFRRRFTEEIENIPVGKNGHWEIPT